MIPLCQVSFHRPLQYFFDILCEGQVFVKAIQGIKRYRFQPCADPFQFFTGQWYPVGVAVLYGYMFLTGRDDHRIAAEYGPFRGKCGDMKNAAAGKMSSDAEEAHVVPE